MIEPTVGVLMLNTHFPRLAGDIGNPESFDYPVVYKTVERANPATVITRHAMAQSLEDDFTIAALELADQVDVISTSCGFLSPLQDKLARQCGVPVITSALTLLPLLSAIHGGMDSLGVMTFDSSTLNVRHLGNNAPTAIVGLHPDDSLRQTIAQDSPRLDADKARHEVLRCALELTRQTDSLRAIVLECTNLSPYKAELRTHTGLAVYDIIDAVHWLIQAQPDSA